MCLVPILGGWAQSPHTISVRDFKVESRVVDSVRGVTGLRLEYTLEMNWLPPAGEGRRFAFSHRIDQAGEPVFHSADIQFPDYQFMGVPTPENNPQGMEKRLRSFIPYRVLRLAAGRQDLVWVASLSTRDSAYRECIRVPFQLDFEPIKRHPVAEQVFRIDGLKLQQRVTVADSGNRGMKINAEVFTQYPRESAKDSTYKLFWIVKTLNGSTAYDSRKAPAPTHSAVQTPILPNRSGHMVGFVDYFRLQMEGPDSANIEIWVEEGQGKARKIHSSKHWLDIPSKFNFEEQTFLDPSLKTFEISEEGRRSMSVYFNTRFGRTGTLRNYQVGDYHFKMEVRDLTGKSVFAKERAIHGDAKWSNQEIVAAALDSASRAAGRFVLPIHLLRLPEGHQSIVVTIRVSDAKGLVKFPVVVQDTFQIDKPKEYALSMTMEELVVRDKDYDLAFEPFTQGNPDLRYHFYIGDQDFFISKEAENTLTATVQSWKCWVLEGEVLQMEVMDVDWGGAPNRDDRIAWFYLDYRDQGNLFYIRKENEGDIRRMRLKVQKL